MSHTIQHPSDAVAVAAEDVPYPLAKRVFDRTVATFLVILLSPLLLLALAVLAFMPNPPLPALFASAWVLC